MVNQISVIIYTNIKLINEKLNYISREGQLDLEVSWWNKFRETGEIKKKSDCDSADFIPWAPRFELETEAVVVALILIF